MQGHFSNQAEEWKESTQKMFFYIFRNMQLSSQKLKKFLILYNPNLKIVLEKNPALKKILMF